MTESSIHRFKTICIFGSTEFGKSKEYLKVTAELGTTLVARKIDIVYGGDSLGLRGIIIIAVNIKDNRILSIILKTFAIKRYITSMTIGNELQVLSMYKK